jgi:hypothetical protein
MVDVFMKRGKKLFQFVLGSILLTSSFGFSTFGGTTEQYNGTNISNFQITSNMSAIQPTAITISDANPFYSLLSTPLAVHYDTSGQQTVIPFYIKNFTKPSSTILRTENELGILTDLVIGNMFSPKDASLFVADTFWDSSSAVMIIKQDQQGYNLGLSATPIACYLNIPIIITSSYDDDIDNLLTKLDTNLVFICGELEVTGEFNTHNFTSFDDIHQTLISIHNQVFNKPIEYLTLANPLDVTKPKILDSTTYTFDGTIGSTAPLPSQLIGILTKGSGNIHSFSIPSDYKYAQLRIFIENKNSEHSSELGDEIIFLLKSPEGTNYLYDGTMGGIPERNNQGDIIQDKLQFETTIYDKPGDYAIQIFGKWFGAKSGSYHVDITIEKLNSPIVPLMDKLSMIAPYLTAYHKGIILAKPEYAFAADDHILNNGQPCPGITQPASNPQLVEPANTHTFQIHEEVNQLLSILADIPVNSLKQLRDYYKNNPINIAITADPTMIPMYYYKNPDAMPEDNAAYFTGFALPSDYLYADIDPILDDVENNTFSYWPYQENMVGRVTGYDVQDASALVARTIFYDTLLQQYEFWKDNALVSTGCGLEFQNLPLITRISHIIYGGRGEPTKFPTGESTFINLRLQDTLSTGFLDVKGTFLTTSQREGFSKDDIDLIKKAGLLNRILFTNSMLSLVSSNNKVTGGLDHLSSNLIFTFAHGSFNLFEHGDILMDARGIPLVSPLARIYPTIGSGLNAKGAFDVRSVNAMEYGPSVMFIVSCITGRTDGLEPENTISQAFLHAGINAYVGATRVTADPGYLDPRPLPGGWGIGTLGLLKATFNYLLKNEYPDFHFGSVIGEDFIIDLIQDDSTTGRALRDAKNQYLPKDANSTFYWTPPLMNTAIPEFLVPQNKDYEPLGQFEETRALDKKYVAIHEFTLYGDPAFNPYQSLN